MKYYELKVGLFLREVSILQGLGYLKTNQVNNPSFIMNMQGTCQSCGAVGPNLWACLQVKMVGLCA